MYDNFSADGAKVKRSRKHSLIGDAKSAHLPETSSPENSHIVQTFIHLAKFFQYKQGNTQAFENATVEIVALFTCDCQSNEGGKFNPYHCLIYKVPQQRVSDILHYVSHTFQNKSNL